MRRVWGGLWRSLERLLEPVMGLYTTYREVEWHCYLDTEHVKRRIPA